MQKGLRPINIFMDIPNRPNAVCTYNDTMFIDLFTWLLETGEKVEVEAILAHLLLF